MSTWKSVLLKYIDGYDSLGSTQQSVTCKKTQNIFVCRNKLYEDILQVLIGLFCRLGPTCTFAGFFLGQQRFVGIRIVPDEPTGVIVKGYKMELYTVLGSRSWMD
jgi:hypothetical protein